MIFVVPVSGQQQFRFSEYHMVANALNPAVVGSVNYLDIKTGYRQQWSGLAHAPETYFISVHGNVSRNKSKNFDQNALRISDPELLEKLAEEKDINLKKTVSHGLGGYVVKDIQGAFSRQEANFSYATHFSLGRNAFLSFGVAGSMIETELDFSQLKVGNPDRDALYNQYLQSNGKEMKLVLNSGVYFYSTNFMLGYSANNLYNHMLEGFGTNAREEPDYRHYLLSGVKLNLTENFALIPGVMMQYSAITPLAMDINLKARFAEIGWIGGTYRHEEAAIGMVGIQIAAPVVISYAYDYALSGLGNFNTGSHEVMIGLRLFNESDAGSLLW